MIAFRHGNERVELAPGASWGSAPKGETYHDTAASELGQIVAEVETGEPWRACVARHYAAANPWLHRIVCDPARSRFFAEQPLPAGSTVLDIGAGWGQLTLPLARQQRVTAVEPTPERLRFIQAAARQEGVHDRITCVQADFLELEFESRFDAVLCIGVLEWVPRFSPGDPFELQLQFLRRIAALLASGGRLIVGIENRLGLKYLLGSSDDHISVGGIAVLDAALARRRYAAATGRELRSFTYSFAEYVELFRAAGFGSARAYAAFPDYKLPALIAPADESLEDTLARTAPPPEHDGSNGQALDPAFQEVLASHYRSFARNRVSRFFAPSYFWELGRN